MPSVNALYREFKAQGLEVLLISFREDPAAVQRYEEVRRAVAPILLDQSGDVSGRAYGVWGPVTFYFVDRQGQLVGRGAGPRGWDTPQSRAFVRALLEADAPPRGPGR